ncbi:LysM peptidoglycan-binding domain-containing protein [Dyella marensis]|uniref:LysM peptidoglycan-binding domain-containing protein n=1 Tax=Dyella marensis TaxID=500610 RepID=UPI0031D6D884
MVAVIAGNGLGLTNTSLSQLGQTQGGAASLGQAHGMQYANIASGNLVLQGQDESLLFDGTPLNFLRTYNSQQASNHGWLLGFTRHVGGLSGTLNAAGSTVTRTDDDGSAVAYAYDATLGAYVSTGQSGSEDRLAWDAGTSTWTWTDSAHSLQETYDSNGQLQKLTNTQTGASYSFSYTGGRLSQIAADDGDTLTLSYNDAGQLTGLSITEIPPGQTTAVTRQQVIYAYDTQGRLSTVTTTLASDTNSAGTGSYTTTYTYDGSSDRIASVTQSDGTVASYTYVQDANGVYRLASATTGTGAAAQTVNIGYDLGGDVTTVTNGLGQVWSYGYDASGRLVQVKEPAVNGANPTTQYSYDANGNLLQSIDANGASTRYSYDADGNLLSVVDATGHTVGYTYNADGKVLTKTTYAVAAQGTVGQPGYVAASGAQTTYYVYDASDRLCFVVDPVGAVTEQDYSTIASGASVVSAVRTYLGAQYDVTSLTTGTPPVLADLQAWVASGAVQATLAKTTLTQYAYDVRGLLASSTAWGAVNSDGSGITAGLVGYSSVFTEYVYDASGRLLQVIRRTEPDRNTLTLTSSYAYDGLGRLISTADSAGITTYAYADSLSTVVITQANGLATTELRNSRGQLISQTQAAAGNASRITSYLYDAAGQPVAAIDPAGRAVFTFYDADGLASGVVDAAGAVTQYLRDNDGRIVRAIAYATTINIAGWISAGALTAAKPEALPLPAASAEDRVADSVYDEAGRLVATIDAAGNVITKTYDGAGNVLASKAYATSLTATQRSVLATPVTWSALHAAMVDSSGDRLTQTVYDVGNRAVATIDASGYVTTTSYDNAGNPTLLTTYATPLTAGQRAALGGAPALSAIQAAVPASNSDQVTHQYYDRQNRLIGVIDAGGYLTVYAHLETTFIPGYTTRFLELKGSAPLTSDQIANIPSFTDFLTLNSYRQGESKVVHRYYDASNRLVEMDYVYGSASTKVTYSYDGAGNLLNTHSTSSVWQGNNLVVTNDSTRTATYDAYGDVLTATDGTGAVTTNAYNADGQLVQTTDGQGNSIWYYYDDAGRLAYRVHGQSSGGTPNLLGSVTAYSYNAFGEATSTTAYASQLSLITGGSGTGAELNAGSATLAQVADAVAALPNAAGDANNHIATVYTANGQVASTTDGDGYVIANEYDAFGDLVKVTSQLSNPGSTPSASNSSITQYRYDQRGQRVSETDDAGGTASQTSQVAYDAFGRVISRTDARGQTISYSYDVSSRQVVTSQVVDGQLRTTQANYDRYDRVVKQIDAAGGVTTYQYNDSGLVTTITTPAGVVTQITKDMLGNTLSTADSAGNTTTYTYDDENRLLTTKDAAGKITTNTYDANGHLSTVVDATGHKVAYIYDADGRLLSETVDPAGLALTTSNLYDGEGRLLSTTSPAGTITSYTYDADGNVLSKTEGSQSGGSALVTAYTYDGAGHVLTTTVAGGTDAASTTKYVYDNLGRLTRKIVDPTGLQITTTYAYDANDNLVASTDGNGATTYTIYNEANEAVFTITPAGQPGSAMGAVTQQSYDANGRVVATHAYGALVSTAALAALAAGTTASNMALGATLAAAAATGADHVSYVVYDADGHVRFAIDPLGNVAETRYNTLGQVGAKLAYATPIAPSAALKLALSEGTAQIADVQAALTAAGDADVNAHATYTYYDANGRVVYSITVAEGYGVTGGHITQFAYDAAGRVVKQTSYGTLLETQYFGGTATTSSLDFIVPRTQTPLSTSTTQYVYDQAGRQVAVVDPLGNASYTFYDAAGNVAATVDAAGAVITYTRDDLGRAINQTGYATTISTSGWLANGVVSVNLQSVLPTAKPLLDRVVTTTYDAAGRVQTVTDGYSVGSGTWQYDENNDPSTQSSGYTNGSVTSYYYDAAGRLVQQMAIDRGGNANPRVNSYYYDANGRLTGALDADWYLTTNEYDAAGHLVGTHAYALQADTETNADVLQNLIIQPSDDDRSTKRYFDAFGQVVGEFDGEYFTQYTYDLDGQQLTQQRYNRSVRGLADDSLAGVMAALVGASSRSSSRTYDAYGQLATEQNEEGTVTRYSYDLAGRLKSTTVADGTADARTVTLVRWGSGNILSQTDGAGIETRYEYDLAGHQTLATDALGNRTWYVYDAAGRRNYTVHSMESDVDGLMGEVVETDYNAFGEISASIVYSSRFSMADGYPPTIAKLQAFKSAELASDNPDQITLYVRDGLGNLVEVISGDQYSVTYSYNGVGDSHTATVAYDGNGDEHVYLYQYNGFGERIWASDQFDSRISHYEYNARGLLISRSDGVEGNGWSVSDRYSSDPGLSNVAFDYDAFGELISATDGNEVTTTYTYDHLGHRISQAQSVDGLQRETHTDYDAYDRVIAETSAMGRVTTYTYDDALRSVVVTAPGNVVTSTTRNREGQVVSSTSAAGYTTTYRYDGAGRLLETDNPDGSVATNSYDGDGRLVRTVDAAGHVTTYTYDDAGRVVVKTVDPDGLNLRVVSTYDGAGLKIAETDASGVLTTYAYDGNGKLAVMIQDPGAGTDHLNLRTEYYYNAANDITTVWRGGSQVLSGQGNTQYNYDALGRATETYPDTGGRNDVSTTYDANGNVTSQGTSFDGYNPYFIYNEANQLIYQVDPVGDKTFGGEGIQPPYGLVTQRSYNADGQLVSIRRYKNLLPSYQYDSTTPRQPQLATSDDDSVSYLVYNTAGQLQFTIDPSGMVTELRYNAAGQVTETIVYGTALHPAGALASALAAGTATSADVATALQSAGASESTAQVTYTYYDAMGRVRFSAQAVSSSEASVIEHRYDGDGNAIEDIAYGALLPLSAFNAGTSADAVAQLVATSGAHITRHVYDGAGREAYGIDANGYVTEKRYDGDGRLAWTLTYANAIAPSTWDASGVSAAVAQANPGASDVRASGLVYDAAGNVIKTLDSLSGSVSGTYTYDTRGLKTSFTNKDGQTWLYQYDSSGNLIQQTSPSVVVGRIVDGQYTMDWRPIVTTYEYDADGFLTRSTVDDGQYAARYLQYNNDYQGHSVLTVDQSPANIYNPTTHAVDETSTSQWTYATYDDNSHLLVTKDAAGRHTYAIYTADDRLAYTVDASGYVTGYQYDVHGNQTVVTRYANALDLQAMSEGAWSADNPLTLSQLQSELTTSSDDRSIVTTYDRLGRKVAVTQPAVTYTRSDGSTATGSPVTTYTYDAYGNLSSQSTLVEGDPASGDAVWATTFNYYDALGHKTVSVDPQGYVTSWTYDAYGDAVSTTEWATPIATAGLVAGGAPPALPGASGADRTSTCTYNSLGQKSSESVLRTYVDASGATVHGFVTTSYVYDGEGRVMMTTQGGRTITTQYDALGRILLVSSPQEKVLVSNWQALLAANPALDLTSDSLYINTSQWVTYNYDAFGNRLLTMQASMNGSQTLMTYSRYDGQGHATATLTVGSGELVDWSSSKARYMTYDNAGHLRQTFWTQDGNDGSTTHIVSTSTYDLDDHLLSTSVQRIGALAPDLATSTAYNAFGEAIGTGDGVTLNGITVYDEAGRAVTVTDPKTGVVHTYGYNLAGQLITDTVPLTGGTGTATTFYTRDLDGRATAVQAPSNSAASGSNAALAASYDRWGNVVSSTDATGQTTTYTYSERNQVLTQTGAAVAVVDAHGNSTTTTTVKTSGYDVDGNLTLSIDENGNTSRTIYDAVGQVVKTVDGTGAASYTAYDLYGREVAEQSGTGHITFKNLDNLGRTVQQGDFELSADGTTRSAVWQQAYVLDQAGNRLISYDGLGAAYLQTGDATNAAKHANYYGYDSQGRVIWSQDAAQRAASQANQHGGVGQAWTQQPTNPNFSDGLNGWQADPGWSSVGSTACFSGQTASGAGAMTNLNRVPVVPGQTVTARGQFQVIGEHGGGAVQILWFDANGNFISAPYNNDILSAGRGIGYSTQTATAPAGAAWMGFGINAINYNIASSVYCYGVSMDYVPPAGAIMLAPDGQLVVSLPNGTFTPQPTNPDFENGDSGWDKGAGWSIHTQDNTSNGSWVGGYGGNGSGYMVNRDHVPVTAGQTISASVQVSLYLSPSGAAAAGAVAIQWFDASGNLISTSQGNLISTDRRGAWKNSSVTASAPPGAAYAALAVFGYANGIGAASFDAAVWNYQYVPQVPTGVIQNTFVYDRSGNLISQINANGDSETWDRDAYGRVVHHVDMSGAAYNYSYDQSSGLLLGESDNWSPTPQNASVPPYVTAATSPNSSTNTYYANGQLATQTFADGSVYSYSYDANGNQTRQEVVTKDGNGKSIHTVTQTTYDSHNRISHVVVTDVLTSTTTLDETYRYDAAGNRREVTATSGSTTVDAWYTYDGVNRVQVSAGALQNGNIVVTASSSSYALGYDAVGNVVTRTTVNAAGHTLVQSSHYDDRNEMVRADYAVDITAGGSFNGIAETRSYDAAGHVLVINQFYALGTTLDQRPNTKGDPDDIDGNTGTGADVGGRLSGATVSRYDSVGRLAEQQNFTRLSGWDGSGTDNLPTTLPGPDDTTYGGLTLDNAVVYAGANASAGYDAMGNVVSYQYRDAGGRVDQYTITYLRKDSYLEAATTGQNISNTPNVRPTTDESYYDSRGNRVAIAQHTQYAGGTVRDTVRVFGYDGNGQIVSRRDGTANGSTIDQGANPGHQNQHFVYVMGEQVAQYDEGGTLNVLDRVTAFSSSEGGPGGYVVQAGDTLKSIAQAVYGNASLWYVIAQANAMSSDNDLSIGQDLTIPVVSTNVNDATTFKPYNPSDITGSTTPSLPTIAPPPPPSQHHCNALAMIVVIAVVVIVTYYAGPQVSSFLYEQLAAAGVEVTATTAAAVSVASAAAAAAAGNAAGQIAGDITGVHQGFSWGEVGQSALSAAATAGVTSGLQGSTAFTAGVDSAGQPVLNGWGQALQGAGSYADDVIASKITGQPTHFSWAGLVSNSLANRTSGALGDTVASMGINQYGDSDYLQRLESRALGDVVRKVTGSALGDNHVPSWQQIGEDVAGNALAMGVTSEFPLRAQADEPSGASRQQVSVGGAYDPMNPLSRWNGQGGQSGLAIGLPTQVAAYDSMNPLTLWNSQAGQDELAYELRAQSAMDDSPQVAAVDERYAQAAPGNGYGVTNTALVANQVRTSEGAIAYSAMHLNGSSGPYVNFLETPDGSWVGAGGPAMPAESGNYAFDGLSRDNYTWFTGTPDWSGASSVAWKGVPYAMPAISELEGVSVTADVSDTFLGSGDPVSLQAALGTEPQVGAMPMPGVAFQWSNLVSSLTGRSEEPSFRATPYTPWNAMYDNAEVMAHSTPRDANGVPVVAMPGLTAAPGVLKRLGDYWAALTAEDNGVTLQGINPFTQGSRMGMEVKNDRLELGVSVVTAPVFGLESAGQVAVREVLAESVLSARGPWFSSSMSLSERQAELATVDTWMARPEGAWQFDFAEDSAQRITIRSVPNTIADAGNAEAIGRTGFQMNPSGPTTLFARDPVDIAAQQRLNVIDGDRAAYAPGEAGAAAEMENYLGGTLERAPSGTSADYLVTSGDFSGARIDFKLTPDSFAQADKINMYFDKTFPKFSQSFADKLAAPNGVDMMPFDTRFLTPTNRGTLFDFVNNLPVSSQKKVIYLVH